MGWSIRLVRFHSDLLKTLPSREQVTSRPICWIACRAICFATAKSSRQGSSDLDNFKAAEEFRTILSSLFALNAIREDLLRLLQLGTTILAKSLSARLMKYNSIRRPELGPLGETFLEARDRAIVEALFVSNPGGGLVDTVLTFATHLRLGPRALRELRPSEDALVRGAMFSRPPFCRRCPAKLVPKFQSS